MGSFYPPETSAADALPFYARVFDTVEVNTTFYAVPSVSTVESWYRRTPPGFRFALKLPRAISHDLFLDPDASATPLQEFLDVTEHLGEKRGPLLVQLPPSFTRTPANRRALAGFLDMLAGTDVRVAVELRSDTWLEAAVEEELRDRGVAWVLTEYGPMARSLLFTARFTYVRWTRSGDVFPTYDRVWIDRSAELSWWAGVLSSLPDEVDTVYGYFSNEVAGFAPATVADLRARLGLPTVDPRSLWPQRQLL